MYTHSARKCCQKCIDLISDRYLSLNENTLSTFQIHINLNDWKNDFSYHSTTKKTYFKKNPASCAETTRNTTGTLQQ